MASTSRTSVIPERDASSQVLSPILERLDEESLKRLEPFIPEIEQQLVRTIEGVSEEKLNRKSREGLTSAAIYDTFLQFEHLTKVRVRTEFIAESLGILPSVVNYTWRHLFDYRVRLDAGRIECINGRGKNLHQLISEVVRTLLRAVTEKPSGIKEWFASVEEQARDLIQFLNKEQLTQSPPDILALVAVYGVIKNQGKPMVPLSQRMASLVCGMSSAMVSKVWLEVFNGGRG